MKQLLFNSFSKKHKSQQWATILGAGIPLLISVCKIPVFSHLFSPAQWGELMLILAVFSFASMALFSWQLACVWRFYNEAKQANSLALLWQQLQLFSFIGIAILTLGSLIWCIAMPSLWIYIIAALVQMIVSQWVSTRLIVLQIEQQRWLWAWISATLSIVIFFATILLTFLFSGQAFSFFIASAVVQILFSIILYKKIKIPFQFSLKLRFNDEHQKMLRYGLITVSIELALMILTLSDRFIISKYCGNAAVGMYSQSFTIAQFAIMGLSGLFFAYYNPIINRLLSFNVSHYRRLLPFLALRYCALFMPIVVWLSLFSNTIADILLAPAYRDASSIFLPVVLSYFLFGLSLLSENIALFSKRYSELLVVYGIALVISITSTFVAVSVWGYKAAAWTTLLAYFLIFIKYNPLTILSKKQFACFLCLVFVLVLQCVAHLLLNLQFWWANVLEAIMFVGTYIVALFLYFKNK